MASVKKSADIAASASRTEVIVLGAELIPADILEEGLLTAEDRAAIALEHIDRTCDTVFHLQILLRA